jgi:hypothetical protein
MSNARRRKSRKGKSRAEQSLIDRVRGWVGEHPEALKGSLNVDLGRPWDASLKYWTGEVERMRKRFPLFRVNAARSILDVVADSRRRSAQFESSLAEQVYRAHYSSLKIQHSWHYAVRGAVALGHLYGVVSDEEVHLWAGRASEPETPRRVFRAIWPDEHLEDLLLPLDDEDFRGHIPLRTGAIVLGLRLVVHEYARRVLDVLHRIHRNDAYTFGLCLGRPSLPTCVRHLPPLVIV